MLPYAGSRIHREELAIVAAFAAVVACFAATTAYGEAQARATAEQSCALPQALLPCVAELDRLRAELHAIERLVQMPAGARGAGGSVTAGDHAQTDATRRLLAELTRMENSRARYESLVPHGPAIRDALLPVQTRARAIVAGGPSRELFDGLEASVEEADDVLEAAASTHRARLDAVVDSLAAAEARLVRTERALITVSIAFAALVVATTIGIIRRWRRDIETRIDELGQFAARVAHDLRSPLMPPMLALDRVRARLPPDDPLAGNVERGARSLKTIERLVEGLLAFASSGTGKDTGNTSVCETLDSVLAEYIDAAAASGITLEIDCPAEVRVQCGAGTLVSIVGNLVGNAIKYMGAAQERRICVRVHGDARARIEVTDTGPGLAAGAEQRIFEPYVRGQSSGLGIGLGLATVKRLVLAHHGSLGVVRNAGCGCTFWVELPVAPDPPGQPAPLRPTVSPRREF
jgi:signal transduction histidine kinase